MYVQNQHYPHTYIALTHNVGIRLCYNFLHKCTCLFARELGEVDVGISKCFSLNVDCARRERPISIYDNFTKGDWPLSKNVMMLVLGVPILIQFQCLEPHTIHTFLSMDLDCNTSYCFMR